MDPATLAGMALAVGALLITMLLEGSSPLAILLLPPMILVFGGTFGAAVTGCTLADVRRIGSWFRLAFAADRTPLTSELIIQLIDLATLARKEGMLPLENRSRSVADPFLRRGLEMAVDGTPMERLQEAMQGEIAAHQADDRVAARFFSRMGGCAPTVGIIGTVVGLVQVLRNLEEPNVLGPLIAAAFVATLWGVLSANFLWLPLSTKIARNSQLRAAQMDLLLTGVSEILAGTNPRAIGERLRSMLPPSEVRRIAA